MLILVVEDICQFSNFWDNFIFRNGACNKNTYTLKPHFTFTTYTFYRQPIIANKLQVNI